MSLQKTNICQLSLKSMLAGVGSIWFGILIGNTCGYDFLLGEILRVIGLLTFTLSLGTFGYYFFIKNKW